MFKSREQIVWAWFEVTGQQPYEELRGDPRIRYIAAMNRRYFRAEKASEKYGFIGVGCITFAENSLVRFQRKLAYKLRGKRI